MLNSFMMPIIIIVSFILAGIISQQFIIKYIIKALAKSKLKWDSILLKSVRKFLVFWFFLAGAKFALPFIQLSRKWASIINKSIIVLLIATVTVVIVKLVTSIYISYSRRDSAKISSTTILVNIVKGLIYILGLLIIFQSLGIKITPLITALGVGGLAVALALQDTLANLFAGLQIIFAGQVRIGDFVRLDTGETGIITDITWRNSTIKTREQNIIVVPNAKLSQAIVTNYYLTKREVVIRVPVGVSYSSDLEKVEKVTVEVAKEVLSNNPAGVKNFTPRVLFNKFNDSSIDMNVILRVREHLAGRRVVHEFIKSLHKRYNKEGIVIPFPIRTVEYMDKK